MSHSILVLFAHPVFQKSRVQRSLLEAIKDIPNITIHDLYENYPDFNIDIETEKKLLVKHDIILFQHPFYWYSGPSLMKEWYDLVLEYNFAYGEKGRALEGKAWMQVLSAGGPETSYQKDGYNKFTVQELLTPIEQTANLCHMTYFNPHIVYESNNPSLPLHQIAEEYRNKVLYLKNSSFSIRELKKILSSTSKELEKK